VSFDFLIKGGFIIDGAGINSAARVMDIGIQGDRIKAVGNLSGIRADKIINAYGLCVSPGFIDTHSHSEFTVLADGRAQGKVYQGVTTEINGNCGLSAAPLYGLAFEQRIKDIEELHIRERWNSFEEYFAILTKRKCAINFMTLVGHGNLRSSVSGFSNRELTTEEKIKMSKLLKDALESGAQGLSTGLAYPPGIYSTTTEIVELAKETTRYDRCIYTTHMRNEGGNIFDSVDEVIKIGLDSGIDVHISHLKTNGEKNWEKMNSIFEKIYNAQSRGLRVTCDRYPYIASATDLDTVLPAWAYEGGHEAELRRLETAPQRLYEDIRDAYPDETCWENIVISTVHKSKNKWMEGKTLSAIGKSLKKMPIECLFEILIEEKLRVGALFFFMNEDNLRSILKVPYSMIGSDSSVRCFDGITAQGKPHPRGFGCFPRILGTYVRDQNVLSLKEAVYKMTGLPAQTFGIKQRGIIADGFFADVTIFDIDRIKDNSTFDNPFEKPEGINYVFVNGIPVLWEGMETGKLPGRILV
jgi:N-acyl-D-amino-acid deacylase